MATLRAAGYAIPVFFSVSVSVCLRDFDSVSDSRSRTQVRNRKGATALDLATEAGHSDVAAVLERERTEREREQVAAALLAELTDGAGTQKGGKQNKGKLVLL